MYVNKETTKIFFSHSLDFMNGKIDDVIFHQYCAFLISELNEIGYEHSELIGWLLEWAESKK